MFSSNLTKTGLSHKCALCSIEEDGYIAEVVLENFKSILSISGLFSSPASGIDHSESYVGQCPCSASNCKTESQYMGANGSFKHV